MPSYKPKSPRLLLRFREALRHLDMGAAPEPQPVPPDRAWHEMLMRLDAEEAERRLVDMEAAWERRSQH